MHKFLSLSLLIAGLSLNLSEGRAETDPVIDHEIRVRLDPDAGEIQVQDRLRLPEGRRTWDLVLHRDLNPKVVGGGASLEHIGQDGHLELLRLTPKDATPITLAYGGRIRHGLSTANEGVGRERQFTAGTIGPEGVFLDGSSGWYPRVPGSLQTFDLTVDLPEGWQAISQGSGPDRAGGPGSAWSESQPQDDIYLISAPFQIDRRPGQGFEAQVWLRRSDPNLAETYLTATLEYVDLYSRLIGPYPYAKFALVENFWETGYGMPSFTLLGPQVIRLPFIIKSSYPHEVLHNWWGNGVYVDYQSGNWSEGLTAYLSDHLMKEREGQGVDYRRDALKSYGDYVRGAADLPLTQFRARHGTASQAIGYGKSAMVFHMLRRRLGDDLFMQGLGRFYRDNRFRAAAWDDLRQSFESVSGQDLGAYFGAWTTREGAPRLILNEVRAEPRGAGYRVTGRLEQDQKRPPFPLRVPLVVHQAQGQAVEITLDLDGRSKDFALDLDSEPVRLAVDPAFDTFRELATGESPVALSNLFGSEAGLIILPDRAPPEMLQGYRGLAEAWIKGHPGWRITADSELGPLLGLGAVWVLGWENRLAADFARDAHGFELVPESGELRLAGQTLRRDEASPVLTRLVAGQPWGWLAASEPAALPGLARKLPHYGKYGYLVFAGSEPQNLVKGQWPAGDSALVHWFSQERPKLARIADRPLAPPP